MKVSNKDTDIYGKFYSVRREYEESLNKQGAYHDQAIEIPKIKTFTNKEIEEIYLSGKLPPGHIIARAKRYAVKMFISHLFSVWYELDRGEAPPKPYPIAILKHAHQVPIPNWNGTYADTDGIFHQPSIEELSDDIDNIDGEVPWTEF